MKSTILLVILLIPVTYFAQPWTGGKHDKQLQKIEQLEKIRLIEILDLDEETSIKFFAKRKQFQQNIRNYHEQLKVKIDDIEFLKFENLKSDELKKLTDEILAIQKKIFEERMNFILGMREYLPENKILKYLVFERKFKEEIDNITGPKRRMK